MVAVAPISVKSVSLKKLLGPMQPQAASAPANPFSIALITQGLVKQASNFLPLIEAAAVAVAPSGASGDNATLGLQNVSYQCVAVEFNAIYAALTSTQANASTSLAAAAYGFAAQLPDGSFNNPQAAGSLAANLDADAFFVASVARAMSWLPSSSTHGFLAAYKKGVAYLQSQQSNLLLADASAPNRLFNDAIALVDASSTALISAGLASQAADGYFTEHGGWDSSYNGVSMLNVGWLIMADVQAKTLTTALAKSAIWQATRILPNGDVDVTGNTRTAGQERDPNGALKGVDYFRVALGLMYAGAILGVPSYVSLGNSVANVALHGVS